MNERLEQSIAKTLSYFDLANYPLTKEELFAYLWQPPMAEYEDFLLSLRGVRPSGRADDEVIPRIEEKFGYFFLPGREEIVENRRRSLLISELKLKVARRAVKKIRSVPFLRAVFVCNSVASAQAVPDSDIDFFIIAEAGRIWIVRFFTNFILRIFGLRTYGDKINNRICLSFYVDDKHLSLSGLRIAPDDIHFAYWVHQMVPLYDSGNYYEKFLSANRWTEDYIPNLPSCSYLGQAVVKDSRAGLLWKKAWEKMWQGAYGDLIEKQAKEWQMVKMKLSVKEKAKAGDKGVVIEEGVIKLHENDRRKEYRQSWINKLNKIKK